MMIRRGLNRLVGDGSLKSGLGTSRLISTVKFPETMNAEPLKPRLSNFRTAFFHFFLLTGTTYILIHNIWLRLEHEEKSIQYSETINQLDAEVAKLIEDKREKIQHKSWTHIFKFWK